MKLRIEFGKSGNHHNGWGMNQSGSIQAAATITGRRSDWNSSCGSHLEIHKLSQLLKGINIRIDLSVFDLDDVREFGDENPAITNFAGCGGIAQNVDRLIGKLV